MNHRFYLKSNKEQVQIQLKIGLTALVFNSAVFVLSIYSGWYLLFFLILAITLSIVAPFIDIPHLKKSGKLIYHSNLFIAEKAKNDLVKIHGGSLFDYVFVLDKSLTGMERKNYILKQYLEGLLSLMKDFEGHKTIKIQGTTYFLNKRTLNRFGFKTVPTNSIQKFILIYNYFNILISNSVAHKRLTFPKLRNISTFECEIGDLINRKELIEGTLNKL